MFLIGGIVFQRQLDGLVVEIDIVVDAAQLDASARAHDERGALLVSLTGIVGHGGDNPVVIACPATLAILEGLILLKQLRSKFDGEVALGIGHDSSVQQVLAIVVRHAPPPPGPLVSDERQAHFAVGYRHAAVGHGLACHLDGVTSDVTVARVGEGDLKGGCLVLAHVHAPDLADGMIPICCITVLK